jgi:outer membrane protein assembly factor BamB
MSARRSVVPELSRTRHVAVWVLAGVVAVVLVACGGSHPIRSSATSPSPIANGSTAASPSPVANGSTAASPSPVAHRGVPAAQSRAVDWPTYHRQPARVGVDAAGPPLGSVRRLWTAGVDGAVYAEPLVAGGKVIVASENDSVYAFDAATGRGDWRVHLSTPVPGGDLPCGNIDVSGITGTPVIDPAAGVVYAVTFQPFQHRLVALDLASGAVRWQRPIDPPGADPRTHQQRVALALSRGRLYVAYGGLYGDCGDYHGWVLGAPASGPTGQVLAYRVPTRREGAIWAPSGPAIDGAGNLYVATGNGSSTSSFDFGNAVIRLTPTLRRTGFFAPANAAALSGADLDLGSTGPLLLPGSRAFIIGKTGVGYLLSTRRLGGIGHPLAARSICGAAFGGDAYARGTIYVPCTNGIVAVRVSGNRIQPVWSQPAATLPPILAGPGLWAVGGPTLYQLDPRTGRVRFRAPIGDPAHFATPAASGGHILVAAGGRVYAFG